MGGNPCALQLLKDQIMDLAPLYISNYQAINPDISIEIDTLARCCEGYTDIDTWAKSITDSINTRFSGRENLILIGHSMGGKAALYAVANDIGDISDKVMAVVTINSPVRVLSQYYVPGGGPMYEYCRTTLLGSDEGVCSSLAEYDSSEDGAKISETKHWLAFASAEPAPLSPLYDRTGVDVWPRNMDDGTVPLPAQFTEDADVIYYGEYGHSDIAKMDEPSMFIANKILGYIFGYPIECSVLARTGSLEHEADWLLGTDQWVDIVGGIAAESGTIRHTNSSLYKWQEWEDIFGEQIEGDTRAYSHVRLSSLPLITGLNNVSWLSPESKADFRIKVKSQAAPLTSIEIDWTIYKSSLFPPGQDRSFYDIEMTEGTPLASIRHASWMRNNPSNPVFWIWSEAQSPFRWFKAEWSIYQKEKRLRKIIDEIPSTG